MDLHDAARSGSESLLRALLDGGAALDRANILGDTPLLEACEGGHVECAKVLLKAGARPSVSAENGATPLYWALRHRSEELVRALLEAGACPHERGPRRRYGDTMFQRSKPPAEFSDGLAPIHWAASFGNVTCLKLLVEAGADPEAQREELTAAYFANAMGHADCVQFLQSVVLTAIYQLPISLPPGFLHAYMFYSRHFPRVRITNRWHRDPDGTEHTSIIDENAELEKVRPDLDMPGWEIKEPHQVECLAYRARRFAQWGMREESEAYVRKLRFLGHEGFARYILRQTSEEMSKFPRRTEYAEHLAEEGDDAAAEFAFSSIADYYDTLPNMSICVFYRYYNLRDFADFMLSRDRIDAAIGLLDRAGRSSQSRPLLAAKSLFLRLAVSPSPPTYAWLKELLTEETLSSELGDPSEDEGLRNSLAHARDVCHPDLGLLTALYEVFLGTRDLGDLDAFEAWQGEKSPC